MMGTLNNQKTVAYEKTVREIAEEIGVSKQAVFKKINRQPLSTKFRFTTVFLRLFSPFISPHFKLSPKQTSIIYCKQGNEPCKYLLEVIAGRATAFTFYIVIEKL